MDRSNMKRQEIVRESELRKQCKGAKLLLKRKAGLSHIVGRSKVIQELCEKIIKISSCNVYVLISGESGTGKELVARAIHYLSCRARKPFIPVNCGAIPESLFENELFGHVKGAFTDAGHQQTGLVKEADGGTLFLDEISVISPYSQVKLLRLLQDKEYKPLGDVRPRKADIRVIAATNRDLQSLMNKGMFREDLFYRLNVVSLHIPPLRERRDDIPILVQHFISKYSEEYKIPVKELSRDAMQIFMSYSWPGNIRELENKIQQAIVMSTTPAIRSEAIKLPVSEPDSKVCRLECFNEAKKNAMSAFEKTYLSQLLTVYRGDVPSAAKKAGKTRTGLWNLLKKNNLSPKQFRY